MERRRLEFFQHRHFGGKSWRKFWPAISKRWHKSFAKA
jgi:hypothetical protein